MKGYSISPNPSSQIFVCGVESAGKKSFLSLFFSEKKNLSLRTFRIREKTRKILFVILLDGIHLQNIEEANLLDEVKKFFQRRDKISKSLLFILGKTDLIYNRRQNQNLLADLSSIYEDFLLKIKTSQRGVIPFSFLATKIHRELLAREIDEEDCDDAKSLLTKAGRHLPSDMSPRAMKTYLNNHRRLFSLLSGETLIHNFIEQWKENN